MKDGWKIIRIAALFDFTLLILFTFFVRAFLMGIFD
jgi:hypothetical protein